MSKPMLGLVLGALLGALDGASAWFDGAKDPALREGIFGIIIGSTGKGLVAGLIAGYVGKKTNSTSAAVVTGLVVGGIFAFFVAAMQSKYYLRITLPGAILGALVGYVAQRYGTTKGQRPATGFPVQ